MHYKNIKLNYGKIMHKNAYIKVYVISQSHLYLEKEFPTEMYEEDPYFYVHRMCDDILHMIYLMLLNLVSSNFRFATFKETKMYLS